MSTYPVFIREKIYIVPVPRPFPYNAFVHILEGQVHKKESKLEIMTMWVKGIFSNIRNVETVLVMNDLLHNL